MKKTVFWEKHKALGAKFTEFAGYEMPVEYTGATDEHIQVRNAVGLFDVSHMGEIWVSGTESESFLQYLTPNDISVLTPGKAQYNCLINEKGGIIDDIIVYCYSLNKYMLVVNASNVDKDYDWLLKNQRVDVEIENASNNISQLALQGPDAEKLLQSITQVDIKNIKSFCFEVGSIAGSGEVIISRTGYTGSGGFELYFYNNDGILIWDAIIAAGIDYNLKPAGLAARDTLRLEKGYCLYGNDIDDNTTPIEAGLQWIVKTQKDFLAKEIIQEQIKNGTHKKLVGIELLERGIPRHGYKLFDNSGIEVGEVTSGTMSPILKKGIGMAYISTNSLTLKESIRIGIRNKNIPIEIKKLPFV